MRAIKFSIPNISSNDIKKVGKILKSGWLTHGKYTTKFEDQIKLFTNSKYAVTVSSCTAGLHLSCLAANFKKGDEVIYRLKHILQLHTLLNILALKQFFQT